jgi:hypothetical protein
MPWSPSDAESHTHKASYGKATRQWAAVANGVRERLIAAGTPSKEADARAVIEANGVVEGRRPATHAHPSRTAPTAHPHRNPR